MKFLRNFALIHSVEQQTLFIKLRHKINSVPRLVILSLSDLKVNLRLGCGVLEAWNTLLHAKPFTQNPEGLFSFYVPVHVADDPILEFLVAQLPDHEFAWHRFQRL